MKKSVRALPGSLVVPVIMFWKRRRHDDFREEIESHLELETERLIAEGAGRDDARLAARRSFGNVTVATERFYESRRVLWLDQLVHDVRSAVRSMAKYPVACAVAVISLAGGIGATTAALIVRETVFVRAPPLYVQPDQLSKVDLGSPERPRAPVPAAIYQRWAQNPDLGAGIAATPNRGTNARTEDRLETVSVRAVTPEFFAVLGVSAALGRTFSPAPVDADQPMAAVLSHRQWQNLFDGRLDVLGRVVWIDDQPHVVIGVLPERFWFSQMNAPIWTLLDVRLLAPEDPLEVVVRRQPTLTPGHLAERLQGDLTTYANQLPAGQRQLRAQVWGIGGVPMANAMSPALPWLLGGAVLLTLLIACANVAILVIAQWTSREHEIAIRASLGASRGRIVRALLTESVVMSALGGVLGIGTTLALWALIVANAGDDSAFYDLSIDPRILIASGLATFAAGIVAGIGPAMLETRRLHGNPMLSMSSSDRVRQRWRHALVVLEITVTVALLVVTGAMIDGYQRNFMTNWGFETRPLAVARVESAKGVAIPRILDVLNRLPGVARAVAATAVPFARGPLRRVAIDSAGSGAVEAEQASIGAGFFATLDVSMRAGRAFSPDDASGPVAILNETLARRLFPNRDPIGASIWLEGTARRVVGVVADYNTAPVSKASAGVYLPLDERQSDAKRMQFLIRATNDPRPVVRILRREIRDAAAGHAVTSAFTVDQVILVSGHEILVATAALVPLIATGMLLTAAGIYGVLAFAIARRSKELAVRVAIGASRRDLIRLVTAHSLRLVAMGMALGTAVTFALTRVARATGGAGSIYDPGWLAFAIPVLIVAGIAALATWVPSRRVLRIDPAQLLRTT